MHRPLVWMAAAFAAGIAVAGWTLLSAFAWLAIAAAACLAALAMLRRHRSAWAVLLVGAAAAGGLWSSVSVTVSSPDAFAPLLGRPVQFEGVVSRPPQILSRGDTRRVRMVVSIERLRTRAGEIRGTVLVTVPGSVPVAYGDLIRVRGRIYRPPPAGNPGERSYRDYLSAAGIDAALTVRRPADLRILGRGRGNRVLAAAYGLRARITAFFLDGLPGAPGAVLASLLLGDDGAIDPTLRDAFRTAGLLHILVVSGAQVALVLGSVMWLGRFVRAPPRPTAIIAAAAVAFFAIMTGWMPSVGRATVMALAGAAALVLRRERDVYTSLALAALVLLVAQPALLMDLGFQLSFAATWGLLYMAPVVNERLPGGPRWLRSLVGMTIGAQVAVLPILAYHVARVSVAGFVANIVVVPVVGLLVPAGFAAAAVGFLVPGAGPVVLGVLRPLLTAVIAAAQFFSRVPGATVAVTPPGPLAVVLMYAALVGAVELLRGRVRITPRRAVAAGWVALSAIIWLQVAAASPRPLVMTFLDVGQGDAILVQTPGGAAMLIDAGGDLEGRPTGYDVGAQRVVPALRRLGVRALDVVVLSHPHEDHAGGLLAVLQNFTVGLVLDAGLPHPAPGYVAMLRWIERTGIPYRLARRGMRLDLGDGVQVRVLHPDDPLLAGTGSDANLNSVVLRVTYGTIGALFPGDLEAPIEWRLIEDGDDLRSAVLKVAHHGSATSSTPEFLDAVRPAVAVISVGAWNPFGHPHRQTLDALDAAGAVVYRTDRDGAVTIRTDGTHLWVSTIRDTGHR